MLNESNIILFVGRTDRGMYPNNKLIIWDDQKEKCSRQKLVITIKLKILTLQKIIYSSFM